ncbi:MAG TPA: hypothetical protein DEG28_10785 [Porphyromonadaceae bacterium]|nr:hypothetical protein [Porphyromonadaceae bacterium]
MGYKSFTNECIDIINENMKINFLLFACFLFPISSVFSQQPFTVEVKNSVQEVLSYAEIFIPQKTHKVGTKEGTLAFPEDLIQEGDSIIVRYLGYETKRIAVSREMINAGYCEILLDEKPYLLEAVVVNRNDLNAEAFFKKKKKKLLLPYFRDHSFLVDFDSVVSGDSTVAGQKTGFFRDAYVSIDSIGLSSDSVANELVYKGLKRGYELNYLLADIFCHAKYRKRFYCDYKGKRDGFDLWSFAIRPGKGDLWRLSLGDEFVCMVSLDEKGYIANIEAQLTSHSNKSESYILNTDYTLFREKIVASRSVFKILPNADNDEAKECVIVMTFSGFGKS